MYSPRAPRSLTKRSVVAISAARVAFVLSYGCEYSSDQEN